MRIPAITRIYSDSIVVTVENLLLLSSPVVDRQYDPARDEALKEARKRDTLEKLEQLLQQGLTVSIFLCIFGFGQLIVNLVCSGSTAQLDNVNVASLVGTLIRLWPILCPPCGV